jgi:hypothetical protein
MARFLDAAPADLEPSCGNAPCNSVPANGRWDNHPFPRPLVLAFPTKVVVKGILTIAKITCHR